MSAAATSSTAVDVVATPRLRDTLRANRGIIVVGALVVIGALLLALAQTTRQRGLLDPAAVDPSGSAALATILGEQGVTVVRTTDAAEAAAAVRTAGGRATLLVAPTAPVSARMSSTVRDAGAAVTVLVAPGPDVLDQMARWASPDGSLDGTDVEAGCSWPIATRTGTLAARGPTYAATRGGAVSCWRGSVVELAEDGTTTTVMGDATAFTNDQLDVSGNAALTLGALGRTGTLVWWLPSANDPLQRSTDEPPSIGDLVPAWVFWALAQVAVAVLLVVWWRGRRLGRVVLEPLPVVVRATETVEGRARLYRRSRARGRAADELRAAVVRRLRARLSLPRTAPLAELVAAVAARTGRTEADVSALLLPGTDPTDDAGLTRLAHELDNLENEVRRT